MSTERAIQEEPKRADAAFETRDFYLACFLRCAGYELVNLRDDGRRKVFVFRDRATRRADVMAFYGDTTSVRPLTIRALPSSTEALPSFRIALMPEPARTVSSKTKRAAAGGFERTAPFSGVTRTRVACAHPAAGQASETRATAKRARARTASRR